MMHPILKDEIFGPSGCAAHVYFIEFQTGTPTYASLIIFESGIHSPTLFFKITFIFPVLYKIRTTYNTQIMLIPQVLFLLRQASSRSRAARCFLNLLREADVFVWRWRAAAGKIFLPWRLFNVIIFMKCRNTHNDHQLSNSWARFFPAGPGVSSKKSTT